MHKHRNQSPFINEINEHVFRYQVHLDEIRTADDHYTLERACLVAFGAQCAYTIAPVETDLGQRANRPSRPKFR